MVICVLGQAKRHSRAASQTRIFFFLLNMNAHKWPRIIHEYHINYFCSPTCFFLSVLFEGVNNPIRRSIINGRKISFPP